MQTKGGHGKKKRMVDTKWAVLCYSTEAYRLMNSKHALPEASMLERILVVLMIGSFGITCAHKTVTQTLLFLMQVKFNGSLFTTGGWVVCVLILVWYHIPNGESLGNIIWQLTFYPISLVMQAPCFWLSSCSGPPSKTILWSLDYYWIRTIIRYGAPFLPWSSPIFGIMTCWVKSSTSFWVR